MPRHTHPRPRGGHSRGHIRAQRVRHILRYSRLVALVWGEDLATSRVTPVPNPLTGCSCELCTNRTLWRNDRRRERQAARLKIRRQITQTTTPER